jgi:hypothetical protein
MRHRRYLAHCRDVQVSNEGKKFKREMEMEKLKRLAEIVSVSRGMFHN